MQMPLSNLVMDVSLITDRLLQSSILCIKFHNLSAYYTVYWKPIFLTYFFQSSMGITENKILSFADVSVHNNPKDCWVIINAKVPFILFILVYSDNLCQVPNYDIFRKTH